MITLENVNKIYSNGLHAVKDVNLIKELEKIYVT